jgi:hypothetical protein
MSRACGLIVFIALLSAGRTAGATPDEGRRLYEEAERRVAANRPDEALELYRQAYAQLKNPRIQLRIAQACLLARRPAEGLAALQKYEELLPEEGRRPGEDGPAIAALRQQLLSQAAAAQPAPVHPPAPPVPPAERRPRLLRTLSYAGYAAAGALLGGAIAAHAVREQQAALYNDDTRCLAGFRLREETCAAELSAVRTAEGLAIAGYVIGGALIATSTALLIVSRRPARAPRLSCAPDLAAPGAGCQLALSLP